MILRFESILTLMQDLQAIELEIGPVTEDIELEETSPERNYSFPSHDIAILNLLHLLISAQRSVVFHSKFLNSIKLNGRPRPRSRSHLLHGFLRMGRGGGREGLFSSRCEIAIAILVGQCWQYCF